MKRSFTSTIIALVVGLVMAAIQSGAQTAGGPLDFTLKSGTSGAVFKLSEQRGKYVAVHFLLKTECPFCLKHTHDYMTKGSQLTNVVQVFVKPDTDEEIVKWTRGLPKDQIEKNPIYRDPEAALAKQMKIPDGYKFHGQVVHYPALVLIGPDGREVFRYVGKANTDRFSVVQLSEKLAELKKP